MGLTFTTAFIAGMLSFISPCILPLAPGYVAMISGVSVEQLQQRNQRIHWVVLLNALLFVLEGGGGYGVLLPSNLGPTGMLSMTRLYQLTALAGVAFHAEYEESRWHWGGQLATGPLFYGAKFSDSSTEDKVWPMLEARAQVGLRYGATVYGLSFGWAFTYPGLTSSLTTPYLGGPMVGIFADRK